MSTRSFAVIALLTLWTPALAGQEGSVDQTYVVTIKTEDGAADVRAVAGDLIKLYGGTLANDETTPESSVAIRISPARARVLAADPRVATMASALETVNWSGGIGYSYDGSGNVRRVGNDTFTYDHANRLIHANVNTIPRDYTYDAFGNRTGCRQWADTALESNCQRNMSIVANKNRIDGATYDAAGNVTVLDTHRYSFDALNMMTRDDFGVLAREFVYTAAEERIAVYFAGSSWRWMIRDTNGKVLREFTSRDGAVIGGTAWQWARDYVWRDMTLLATRQSSGDSITTYHYHTDHLGTPRRITDDTDQIVGVHDYFAFGPETSGGTQEPVASSLKYTGHERDSWAAATFGSLDYMHARYYEPDLGRFLSVDPVFSHGLLRMPQGWNRYSYALNNTMRYIDPTGREVTCVPNPDPKKPPICGETIVVEGKIPGGGSLVGGGKSIYDLMEWMTGRLPRVSAADLRSAQELANTPAMDTIREKFKKEDCKEDTYWADYQYSELASTHTLTGQIVGGFGAKIRPIGHGQIVVKAFNTWGLESASRYPAWFGGNNRGNASVEQMIFGGAPLQWPKSVFENRPNGILGTGVMGNATLNYIWIEGNPCAQ